MSPLVEVQLVTWRELQKSIRSAKGGLLAALTVAGGGGASMLFAWLDRLRREKLPEGVDVHELQQQAFSRLYDADTAKALADCPYSMWMMLIATLWLGPLLVALMGFDAVSGELQHRTVRYWAVRTRRGSYIVGKYLGAWLVVLGVTLGMNVIVWGVTATVGRLPLGLVVAWGVRFFAISIPISAAWCGVATLVGSQFRSPVLALLVICAAFFALWLAWVISGLADAPALSYLYPNAYDRFFLSPRPSDAARGLLGTIAIAALTAGASAILFERRDL
jgi:ABC-type transport system involved in multi-copper enzyme maturation permease subunit